MIKQSDNGKIKQQVIAIMSFKIPEQSPGIQLVKIYLYYLTYVLIT